MDTEQAPRKDGQTDDLKALSDRIAAAIELAARDLRLDPRDLTWHDFREYHKIAFGAAHAGRVELTPRHISRVGGFYVIRDAYFGAQEADPAASALEKARLRREAGAARRVELADARELNLLRELGRAADRFPKLAPLRYLGKRTNKRTREREARLVNVLLTDLHYGARLRKATGTHDYTVVEEARRSGKVALEVAEYKCDYRPLQGLRVLLGGDIFEGQLHDKRTGAPKAEQQADAIWNLEHMLRLWAVRFQRVDVYCVSGNHDRNLERHQKHAVDDKWDSGATVIYYALRRIFQDTAHVRFHIPLRGWAVAEGVGGRLFLTHGDNIFPIGNPHKSIPVERLEYLVTQTNAAPPDGGAPFDAFAVGHVHKGVAFPTRGGPWIIANPPLLPPGPVDHSYGSFENRACGQWIWESTARYPVGDFRLVTVSDADGDARYEKAVAPFPGIDAVTVAPAPG